MSTLLSGLFTLRGELTKKQQTFLGIFGAVVSVILWDVLFLSRLVPEQILPSPRAVFQAFFLFGDELWKHILYTTMLNLGAFALALLFSVPLGYSMGLLPFMKGLSGPMFVGLRFLPLPVTTGLFMALGIGIPMKITFLAFAIFVYLVPTIAQRVEEVPQVYLNTIKTLGANWQQQIRHVYIPEVLSRVWDDVVILVGISWTYLSIIELIDSENGLGRLMYIAQRTHGVEDLYALLIIVMILAFTQTLVFKQFGEIIFPFKKIRR